MNKTDIVIIHRNRLAYLKRTLKYLWKRTKTSYRISIIDNHSNKRNRKYLLDLLENKKIFNLQLNGRNVGPCAATNQALTITTSQPFVLMPDDVLVPDVKPDWLERLLKVFKDKGEMKVGMLVLNDPTNDKNHIGTAKDMILCKSVDCSVGVINREVYKLLPIDSKIVHKSALMGSDFWERGGRVGYLKETYCKHIGKVSAFRGLYEDNKFTKSTFIKVNPKTLKPL